MKSLHNRMSPQKNKPDVRTDLGTVEQGVQLRWGFFVVNFFRVFVFKLFFIHFVFVLLDIVHDVETIFHLP